MENFTIDDLTEDDMIVAKIIKCSGPKYWYKNEIGEEFLLWVRKTWPEIVLVTIDFDYDLFVNENDIEILEIYD